MRVQLTASALLLAGVVFAADSGVEYPPPEVLSIGIDATGDTFITTLFAQNNNFAGNSFDLVSEYDDIVVVGWECNLATVVPTFTIDIFWRVGTCNGNETDTTLWTYLGQDVVVPQGIDVPTHIDVGGLYVSAGETIGVIITAQEAVSGVGGFHYTNGGPTTFSNADVEVITYCGLGSGWPPSGLYHYRQWNGTVHYDYGISLERSTWANIKTMGF